MRTFAVLGIVLALGSGATGSQSDEEVRATIEKALEDAKIKGLAVSVQGKTVSLKGRVRNVFDKEQALELALGEPSVDGVDADIEISQAESDQQLGEQVVKELRKYSRFTVFDDASAYVEGGRVALFGWVTEPYKKEELQKRLRDVIGIQEFANDIEVLPTSQSDERLRQALWSRLYRDPTFSDFASMPIPPIHIIVSRSRVILTGVVNNQLMKQKAESIIRQTPGVLSVESRLRIGS
ncbi:MAG TPA: BON domain-containing protein [Vicinamibacteria bacterium]|nr:BON domain-containing protein [Vicinamibacteria bacterium]